MNFKKIPKANLRCSWDYSTKSEPTKMDLEMELLKNWVEDLRKIKSRDYIFRKLISAITYILSNGNPIQVNDKSTDIVKVDFLNFLLVNDSPAQDVSSAMETVLGWYTYENPDVVMETYVKTTVHEILTQTKVNKPKTFKEQLIEKAEHSLTLDDIQNHIETIKKIMNDCYNSRTFTLDLVYTKPDSCIILEADHGSRYSIFVPQGCSPQHYAELFVKAFNTLGFVACDMTFDSKSFESHNTYSITLKW